MRRRYKAPWLLVTIIACFMLAISLSACDSNAESPDPSVDTPPASNSEVDEPSGAGITAPEDSLFTAEQVEEAEIECVMIQQGLIGSYNICAVAMIGFAEGDLEDHLVEIVRDFPVVAAIPSDHWIETEGDEVYLVIPRDPNASVAVNEWVMSPTSSTGPYEGEVGDVLYRSDYGDPIIVRGNISEISPNIMISIVEDHGDSLNYIPFCNLLDGTLDIPAGSPSVLDYTVYPSFFVSPSDVPGDWTSFYGYKEDGGAVTCSLTIGADGYLAYMWGPSDGLYENFYEGSWTSSPRANEDGMPSEAVVFDLTLTEGTAEASDKLVGTFALAHFPEAPDYLYIEYIDGDPLVYTQKIDGVLEFGIAFG